MTLEYNSYRMAWGLLSLKQKQEIYAAMKELPGGELAAEIIMADFASTEIGLTGLQKANS